MTGERDRHLFSKGPKRVLSLDGGGVRGLVTLGVLLHLERELARRTASPGTFRLCQYFDLIGGTSVGALIATMLALGLPVQRIVDIFFRVVPQIFSGSRVWAGITTQFDAVALEVALQDVFAEIIAQDLNLEESERPAAPFDTVTMNSPFLKTGLAIVAKRADTNSVWVLTNNPKCKYWSPDNAFWAAKPVAERELFIPNADYQLLQVLRASASAPYYFQPIRIDVSREKAGTFVDGGASPFNNPAQELLLMCGLRPTDSACEASPTGFQWPLGRDRLLMVSVGCGKVPAMRTAEDLDRKLPLRFAFSMLHDIIDNASESATAWMQALSHTVEAEFIDYNVGDMQSLTLLAEPLLTFSRFNPHLDAAALQRDYDLIFPFPSETFAGLAEISNAKLGNLNRCFDIGTAVGRKRVRAEVFPDAFNIAAMTVAQMQTVPAQMQTEAEDGA